MAVCALSKVFRRLSIFKKDDFPVRFITTQTKIIRVIPSLLSSLQIQKSHKKVTDNHLLFSPRSVSLNFDITKNELPLHKIIESPMISNFQIDEPIKNVIEKSDIVPSTVIEAPTLNIIEKKAERMIVIRRKKMKKHKKRKFLKRMKYVLRKQEQRRKAKEYKIFYANLQEMQRTAEEFDPKKYVAERLHLLTRERLPNKWYGWYAPKALIKQFIKEREEAEAVKLRRRTYKLKVD
ncbi:uncharacterized protein LOC131673051 [Phymastichus coffea]|uniref:uncharacterized protein LOC131673051 n=1 Tax=Phymastichus coffea TaxID=108790 RepID=UPI00273B1EC3|nr:uncharacterized protein LOC131673051 [Phymastichus coffea]